MFDTDNMFASEILDLWYDLCVADSTQEDGLMCGTASGPGRGC